MSRSIRRIVVRRDDNLGDIVIALPVLKALRSHYPNAEISLMVKESHRLLCEHVADHFLDPVSLEKFPRAARTFDLAFNIDYFGPGNREKQSLKYGVVNHINAVPGLRRRPMSHHLLDGLAAFDIPVPIAATPRLPIPASVRIEVRSWLRNEGIMKKGGLWIGLHVGSRVAEKCWPIENFIRLSCWLRGSFGARLFFLGAKNEESAIHSIVSRLPEGAAHPVIGHPLDFVAGLLGRMDFIIGNDSGIGHLASAVRTPTVSIFGPTSPIHWRPSGTRSIVVTNNRKTKNARERHTPSVTLSDVKQGIYLCIQQNLNRNVFPVLDLLSLPKSIYTTRTPDGTIVRAGVRGPACLVQSGWRRVKQILDFVREKHSYQHTLKAFPDAEQLLDLFILHGIIYQGRTSSKQARTAPRRIVVSAQSGLGA